jgi:hypothetical protein
MRKSSPIIEEPENTKTEFVHIAGKSQVNQVLNIMEDFYTGG